jgi:geranylgeranyl diphosphate synthase type I
MSAGVAETAIARVAELVGPAMRAALGRLDPELRGPVEHHLAGGGKGLRAALAVIGAAAAGGVEAEAVPGAVAVELVHNYSLIHDDVIDGDEERRHRPSVWSVFGVPWAIVAGDALANLALSVLLEQASPSRLRAAQILTEATGLMIGGQAQDMAFEGRQSVAVEECLRMAEGKTGSLLGCASAIGAVLAGAADDVVKALEHFGQRLGLAFQAVDDVLGIWGESARTGKPVGSDLLAHKKSLPVAIALARGGRELAALLTGPLTSDDLAGATAQIEATGAREEAMAIADRAYEEAMAALRSVSLVPAAREELAAIARFVTERDR